MQAVKTMSGMNQIKRDCDVSEKRKADLGERKKRVKDVRGRKEPKPRKVEDPKGMMKFDKLQGYQT